MNHNASPEIPPYKGGKEGLETNLGRFLQINHSDLDWSRLKTKKGSIGFLADYAVNSSISFFVYLDEDVVMLDVFWNAKEPSKMNLVIKIPIINKKDYDSSLLFCHEFIKFFTDTNNPIEEMNGEDLEEEMHNITLSCGLYGATIYVEADENFEEETDGGSEDMVLHEKPLDRRQIMSLMDQAVDSGDKEEFERLQAMLESSNLLRNIKGFDHF